MRQVCGCPFALHADASVSAQDQRLNYVEQHAERIGVDAGRLENLRVSAAKGSIMGDTLDVCARQVDARSLEALVPVLSQLVKRGVGLNTQAGAARFISSLAMRMGSDLQAQSGALLKASRLLMTDCRRVPDDGDLPHLSTPVCERCS